MAKTKSSPLTAVIILVVIAAGFGAYLWLHKRQASPEGASTPAKPAPVEPAAPKIAADHVDPANEGRLVTLQGPLDVHAKATDIQLGISADAVMLLRFAEMLQWRQTCNGANCTYQEVWSPQIIDSGKFPADHRNPGRLPITSARFSSGDVRLGAFHLDAAALGNYRLGASLRVKPVPLPVTSAELPSNLGMTFRDANGALYAGDPAHRKVGDVRISYRVIPAGNVEITGTQRGDRIIVQKATSNAPQP
ncbi:MAG TPA: TMEM43 family protein [Rhodanobacteraceae bacterium]|nr:TMEM43 family protein [Rhodanobacteraceae bacterium]